MADQKLIDEVGRYIDKYYKPENDDIKLDHEMLSVFDKISEFRKKRAEKKNLKLKFRGSENQRIINVKKSLEDKTVTELTEGEYDEY